MNKILKITITIAIAIVCVCISKNNSYAKYSITKELSAIKINIDRTPPVLKCKFEKVDDNHIKVIVNSNEELKEIESWELKEDKKTLTKVYTGQKVFEEVSIKDIYGNASNKLFFAEMEDLE